MVNIKGSTVVVTGGQRGLGKSIVEEFLARGAAKVYATARAPKPSDDPRLVSVELDVTKPESVAALAITASDADIVVNNAGVLGAAKLLDSDIDEVKAVFETNYFGALRVAKAFAPILAENGGGALVDISSALSWAGGFGGYGDSKAAIWSLTNSLRIELEKQGTLVTAAHLGYTETDMTTGFDVPKNDPRDVARQIVDGVENGDAEVLADELTRQLKAMLSGPVEALRVG
ncbi:NAD(P)-dependent dehydrogenase, short-chain alcohol dehydrogenase family [Mycobacterium numidiamassiliense]|jgi:NAD(P)-dependent dehydrogenase (short-subunit alcohol dehydrogenase family)|uniref:NAD(P)-dependent dehydrogenase, short-chain alcohol dehydrogenase family n=1 Tax=Mycobacterium numidiamassiliense TaxID=1841861 RepID=A0A2U3P6D3_9MYCO|nr:SDR family oxidoreductase [Mycobacterium numidiamassiliense]SPM39324.1 NAD(P)-dependent dehydrogenase, short-chain alcohol dehydrogenase family [Mycobacterium numidiamassiliense]